MVIYQLQYRIDDDLGWIPLGVDGSADIEVARKRRDYNITRDKRNKVSDAQYRIAKITVEVVE